MTEQSGPGGGPAHPGAAGESWTVDSVDGGIVHGNTGAALSGHGAQSVVTADGAANTTTAGRDVITYQILQASRVAIRPQPVSAQSLRELAHVFVRPGGWSPARERLEAARMVLLSGQAGDGRHAAAWMLAAQAGGGGSNGVWRIPADVDAGDDLDALPRDVPSSAGLLLDLRGTDPSSVARQGRRLEALRARIASSQDQHLVVLLAADQDDQLPNELRGLVVPLTRPGWKEVLGRHWDAQRPRRLFAELRPNLDGPEFAGLADATIRQVSQVADDAARRSRDHPDDAPVLCLRQSWEEMARRDGGHSAEIDGLLIRDPTGGQAALLVAAVMLEGADPDAVFHAEGSLATACGFPPADAHALAAPGYRLRLYQLGVRRDDSRRVRFDPPGRAAAGRRYVWDNYPALRPTLLDWATGLVTTADRRLSRRDLTDFAIRFTEQSLRVHQPEDALTLARRWLEARGSEATASCSRLLTKGLEEGLDGTGGQAFRQRILDWSEDHRLNVHLAEICVQLCGRFIAGTYPRQALTRLHNFTAHDNREVADTAIDTAAEIAAADDDGYRHLLDRVIRAPRAVRGTASNSMVFLRLSATDRLYLRRGGRRVLDDPDVRALLCAGWRLVLNQDLAAAPGRHAPWRFSPAVEERIHDWLDGPPAALAPPAADLADLLVDGVRDRFDLLATIRIIAGQRSDGPLAVPPVGAERPRAMAPHPRGAPPADDLLGPGGVRAHVIARIDRLLAGEGEPDCAMEHPAGGSGLGRAAHGGPVLESAGEDTPASNDEEDW
ncbi:hypothetical protein [Frankia sp. ACN1ag]|uniref:hypothetical protein n=1 Tax=Frankia sp. ACN1ag TaxID=102891 RepID=UPI0006DC9085|nr:hypothetical protein [Frankia sp. ACN1ag]KQC38086.1 hypothetical protein UK82_12235 [Frankia sp. ACN1ag]